MSPNDKHSNYKISKNCNLGYLVCVILKNAIYIAECRDAWILPSLASIMLK